MSVPPQGTGAPVAAMDRDDRSRALAGRRSRLDPQTQRRLEERLQGAGRGSGPASRFPRRDPDEPVSLSFAQQRLWFFEQLYPGTAAFNEYGALSLRGPVSVEVLEAAFAHLVRRHPTLRSGFVADDGVPRVSVADTGFTLQVVDLRGVGGGDGSDARALATALAEAEAARPFALSAPPLLRALLIRIAEDDAMLVVTNHHLVSDDWSRNVLLDELTTAYDALLRGHPVALDGPAAEYADFAAWQRVSEEREAATDIDFWRRHLADPPTAELPTDRPRPAVPSFRGGRVRFTLPPDVADGLRRVARVSRASTFAVLLAGATAVLGAYTGQDDVIVGCPVSDRPHPDLARVVGFFVDTVVLRNRVDADEPFTTLVGRVRDTLLTAMDHRAVPFERLVEELAPRRQIGTSPFYQVLIGMRTAPPHPPHVPGAQVEVVDLDNGTARGDLSFVLAETPAGIEAVVEYSHDLFDQATVEAMTGYLTRFAGCAAADPDGRVAALLDRAIGDGPARGLVGPACARDHAATGVVEALLEQARRSPDREAVRCGTEHLTCAELVDRSGRIAALLRHAGLGSGARIGVHLSRSVDLVAVLPAVLAVGAAYVPLDPAYPAERLRLVASLAGLDGIVVDAVTAATAPSVGVRVNLAEPVDLDGAAPLRPQPVDPGALAYVMFTSGSTGTPKGVMVTRGNLEAFLCGMDGLLGEEPAPTRWLATTSESFDISVLELLWTASRGHHVTVRRPAPGPGSAAGVRTSAPQFSLSFFSRAAADIGGSRYRLLLDSTRYADEHGFTAVWLPERHFHEFGGAFPAPAVLGAAVAAGTTRLGIRAGSVVLPLHHPVRVAEDWAVVDNLSGGRVGLSFASGWHVDDFVLAPEAYEARRDLLAERLGVVRALWRGEAVTFPAPGGRSVEVSVKPRPVQPELACWITASGSPETFRLAGRTGCGLLTHLLGQSLPELAERICAYREAWTEAGHPGTGHVTLMLHTFVGTDPATTVATARPALRTYLRSALDLVGTFVRTSGGDVTAEDLTDDDVEALLDHATDRYLDTAALIGTVDQCSAFTADVAAAGVDEIACLIDFGIEDDVVLAGLEHLDVLQRRTGATAAEQRWASPASVAEEIIGSGITHFQCTPSLLRMLLADPSGPEALARLRLLAVGGEAFPDDLAEQVARHTRARVVNLYGPTETTVWSSAAEVEPSAGRVGLGTPIRHASLYVLDPAGRRVPPGAVGELWIGGDGVSAGYLDQPEPTAAAFREDPFAARPGARMYRTGDFVRLWRGDTVVFLGRRDRQVKLRGHRIELREVEQALVRLPGVRQAVVVVADAGTDAARLLGFVVRDDAGAPPASLRSALTSRLPGYMVPARLVDIPAVPLTPNGKVDTAALPTDAARAVPHQDAAAEPASEPERRMARLWASALGVDRVGRRDDFFALGGHSLLATQLIARVRAEFGVDGLGLRSLFEGPTVADLTARVVEAAGGSRPVPLPPATVARVEPRRAERYEPFPLTDVQRAYWVGRSGLFDLGGVSCHLYLEHDLPAVDLDRLERCLNDVIARHDMLRAVIRPDGRQQVLAEVPPYRLTVLDLRGRTAAEADAARAQLRAEMSHQVLADDAWPLFDIRATRTDRDGVRLHVSIDTLIADGGSVRLLLAEWLVRYLDDSAAFRPLDFSFRDYVLHLRAGQEGAGYARALDYWRSRLRELPGGPDLPLVRRPQDLERVRFRRREAEVDAARWAHLTALAAHHRATPSSLLLAVYAEVLGRRAASPRFSINLTLFNREPIHPDVTELVGDFTALIPLEIPDAVGGTFADRLRGVQAQVWSDLDHREVSGVRVQAGLDQDVRPPAMPVVFTSELGVDLGPRLPEGFTTRNVYTVTQTPQVWLDHQVREDDGVLRLTWDAVDDLFAEGFVDGLVEDYLTRLAELADPATWQAPAAVGPPASTASDADRFTGLHEPFVARARRHPAATALEWAGGSMTYGALDRASTAVADRVRRLPQDGSGLVAVFLDRGWRQVAAVLGVVRAGLAYVPVDPALPADRVRYLLEHSQAAAVLTGPGTTAMLPDGQDAVVIELSDDAAVFDDPEADARTAGPAHADADGDGAGTGSVDGSALAYVIYTSGSTGRPKGVMVDHGAALNTILDVNERFGVGPRDKVLALSSLSFDLSVFDVFGTLAAGAALVLTGPGDERDALAWARLIARHQVTVWNSVPALMEMLVEAVEGDPARPVASLRLVLLSGDWIPVGLPDRVRALAEAVDVVSLGGATEAAIWSVCYPIGRVDPAWTSIPYGRALRNQSMHVLDERMQPCPVGVPGDLYIGGCGLARGYWSAEDLTAAAFVQDGPTGARLYRTGDRALLAEDGELRFLGRADTQVKINGYRVELGEIEAVLTEQPGVRQAVAVLRPTAGGDNRELAAFVVMDGARAEPSAGAAAVRPSVPERCPDAADQERHERLRRLDVRMGEPGRRADLDGRPVLRIVTAPTTPTWRRASAQGFGAAPVATADFAAVVQALAGAERDGLRCHRWPSAGGLYPVQAYVCVADGRVSGVQQGCYYVDPRDGALVRLTGRNPMTPEFLAPNNARLADEAAFGLLLVSCPSAIEPLYPELASRFTVLEAGAMVQVLSVAAADVPLASCPVGDLWIDPFRADLGLADGQELLAAVLLGPAVATAAASGGGLRTSVVPPERDDPAATLHTRLTERLPAYMVPRRITVVDSLPLTANGKVDRQTLAAPPQPAQPSPLPAAPPAPVSDAPGTATVAATVDAATVQALWAEVLGVTAIAPDQNFFDLGADSVHLVRVQRRIRDLTGCELSAVELFDHPTVRALAAYLAEVSTPAEPADGATARADTRRAARGSRRDRREQARLRLSADPGRGPGDGPPDDRDVASRADDGEGRRG